MCRSKSHGGRRCTHTPGARKAHNRRRRENRAIRANVIAWMRGQDDVLGSDAGRLADGLDQLQPGQIKGWLHEHGVDPDKFKDGIPDKRINPQFGKQSNHVRPESFVAGRRKPERAAVEDAGARVGSAAVRADPVVPARPSAIESGQADNLHTRIEAAVTSQGTHRDERSLLSGQPVFSRLMEEGTNNTYRVELDNGMVGYHKPFNELRDDVAEIYGQGEAEQPLHEVAAWRLAAELGPPYCQIVPPVVLREHNGQLGSFAAERPGIPAAGDVTQIPEWRDAAFFDALIGQQDRHPNNYLVAGDRVALIDNGYAFARPGDPRNYSWFTQERVGRGDLAELTDRERGLLERVVASKDLFGVRKVLSDARADAVAQRAGSMLTVGRVGTFY